MAEEPVSLIDGGMPSQGMPLGGMSEEEIEVEEIEEPTDIEEQDDGSVVLNFEEMLTEQLQAEPDANLAEVLDERVLMEISSELVGYYDMESIWISDNAKKNKNEIIWVDLNILPKQGRIAIAASAQS